MRVTIWGSRGSIAAAGPDTVRYGGNTSCVEVLASDGTQLILDAGTGLRRLGASLDGSAHVAHLLLTHLHMDHIVGLGFFRPFFDPDAELHVWGPPSTTLDLRTRLTRYLSPPLFPVRLRDLDSRLELHDVPLTTWTIGPFTITADLIVHSGPTVGYRISEGGRTFAYLPDHEPALGGLDRGPSGPQAGRWPTASTCSSTTPNTRAPSTRAASAGATTRSSTRRRSPGSPGSVGS
ncbi:MAG: MBL fold metallo-hydrolase [Chloroflexi bacterium]|nr:MBL fold metallo-hydrolase [Chloroflexota bacterium]